MALSFPTLSLIRALFTHEPEKRITRNCIRRQRGELLEPLEMRQLLSTVSVVGNSVAVVPGSTTPSVNNYTDFRLASTTNGGAIGNVSVTRTYTLTNTGLNAIDLSGGSFVSVSGTNASDFHVTEPTATSLASGAQTTFTITFTPTAAGVRSATVTLSTGAADPTPFTFAIQGTGVATAVGGDGLEVATTTPGTSKVTAANGDILSITYTGYRLDGFVFDSTAKQGGSPLTFRLDDSVGQVYLKNDQTTNKSYDTSLITGWEEGLQGMKIGETRFLEIPGAIAYPNGTQDNSIPAGAPIIFEVTCTNMYYSPAIGVQGLNANGTPTYIPAGSTVTNTGDGTNFGNLTNAKTKSENFYLYNYSAADDATGALINGLSLQGFNIQGPNAKDFIVQSVVGQAGVYAITFKPHHFGTSVAIVHVLSNDANTPDYTFTIRGTYSPVIDLTAAIGNVNFPTTPIISGSGATLKVPVVLTNTGTSNAVGKTDAQVYAVDGSGNKTLISSIPAVPLGIHANGHKMVNLKVPVPTTLGLGTYTLEVDFDTTKNITETSYTNNSANTTQTFSVAQGFYNLTGVLGATTLPPQVLANQPLSGALSLSITEAGNLQLPKGQQVTVQLLATNTADNSNVTLATSNPISLSGLKAGATKNLRIPLKIAAGMPAGSYTLAAQIVPVQALAESNTADNLLSTTAGNTTLSIQAVNPNITATLGASSLSAAITATATRYSGTIGVNVANTGGIALPVREAFMVTIIAHSTTGGADVSFAIPAKISISRLAPGAVKADNVKLNFTGDQLAAGSYVWEAQVTPVPALTETSTTDNLATVDSNGQTIGLTVS